jgi:hypothetical protein
MYPHQHPQSNYQEEYNREDIDNRSKEKGIEFGIAVHNRIIDEYADIRDKGEVPMIASLHPHYKIGELHVLQDLNYQICDVADFVVTQKGVREVDEPFLDTVRAGLLLLLVHMI